MDVIEVENESQNDVEMKEVDEDESTCVKEKKSDNDTLHKNENVKESVEKEQMEVNINDKPESKDSKQSEEQPCAEKDDIEVIVEEVNKEHCPSGAKPRTKTPVASEVMYVTRKPACTNSTTIQDVIDLGDDDDDDNNAVRVKTKFCCNYECESRESLQNAPRFVLSYFGLKIKKQLPKVCKYCLEKSISHNESLAYLLMKHEPLHKADYPEITDVETIDDTDDDLSDEEPALGEEFIDHIDDQLEEVIDSSYAKYDLEYQITEVDAMLKAKFGHLKDEYEKQDEFYDSLQREIDDTRTLLYQNFVSQVKEISAEDINDVPGGYISDKRFKICTPSSSPSKILPAKRSLFSQDSPRRPPLAGVAIKKVTSIQRSSFPGLPQIEVLHQLQPPPELARKPSSQQDVVALEQIKQVIPTLPPMGILVRPRPQVNDVVYVMRTGFFGIWQRAKILEAYPKSDIPASSSSKQEYLYKTRFESRKASMVKTVTGKQVAYQTPSNVRVPVGTRVIALFTEDGYKESFYAGVVAEPPKAVNNFRYLVFFDDGYAQYVVHDKILVVSESSRNVWEDIHPDAKEFVKSYLDQYPERPMLKLQQGQIVKTEWNGKWWIARVLEVDGSLVKMYFDADGRTELIYRGSTRLGPLFSELHNADVRKKLSTFGRHRSMGISSLKRRNMPYVEYTRTDLEDNRNEDSGVTITVLGSGVRGAYEMYRSMERNLPTRAVAKKSTTTTSTTKRMDAAREHLEALIISSDKDLAAGHVESIHINATYVPRGFVPHQCGPACVDGIKLDFSQFKRFNPLVLPQLHGWERTLTKYKGKKIVFYKTPCGRRVRNVEELHRYLRVAKCDLSVDLFDFDSWVHCYSEFVMKTGFINIKDLSYGEEHVPVPCVNNRDHIEPEFVKYSTRRLPMAGVKINTDENFLVGCDCTDDCQDKSKCACWQLTIRGTAYGTGGKVDTAVGYCFKRLREPVMTGIYECNSRCKCMRTCLNRVAQHPLQLRLQVFKTENRGWGIRCLNDVPHGAFICIYAGRLLTEQGANEGGKNYGDEYLAELDYIEVVERLKEGYESDVAEDDDALFNNDPEYRPKEVKSGKEQSPTNSCLSEEEEEEEDAETSQDAHDSDFEFNARRQSTSSNVPPTEESTIRTRLRNRKGRNSSTDSQGRDKDSVKSDSVFSEKDRIDRTDRTDRSRVERGSTDDSSSLITLSDDDDDEHRERQPSRFAVMSGPKKEIDKKNVTKSVREYYGDDEYCYIMDAKNVGNIGRYLNHSCTPNVFVQNVFVDTHDLRFPWVAFFALTYISAGTELTWDYNYDVGSVPGKVLHCYCGSNECRGRLL